MPDPAALSFSAEQVRRLDRDRFATALFAPGERREALFALYAFNAEVAQIRELIREPLLGRIRLQWWRESLESLRSGKMVAHPVAEALGRAMSLFSLPFQPFEQLLTARERDMETTPPEDMAALEAYAEGTAGAVTVLAVQILGGGSSEILALARSLGVAWALTGLLRAVPFHAAAGRLYLPSSLLTEQGLSAEDVLAGRNSPGLARVAKAVATAALGNLKEARCSLGKIPRTMLPAFLTAPLAESYLGALAKQDFDLFERTWSLPRPQPLRLGWAMLRGRF
jgi:phytoene synthase